VIKSIFKYPFVCYEPDEVRLIRNKLGETRKEFARRFFVDYSTVKGWESKRGSKKHREVLGAAARVMLWTAEEANKCGSSVNNLIRRIDR